MSTLRAPAVFLGHGSPMNAIEHNRFTDAWKALGVSTPKPRAVLAISAHWYVAASAVTAMAQPRVIHDFFGFPKELFDFDYPAPGAPDVAAGVTEIVKPVAVGLDMDSWGLDHGTWSVLAHVFPAADVPVVQLSIDARQPLEYHLDLGARLAPLLEHNVMIVASGNIVHNLGRLDWASPTSGFDWARRFDEAVREQLGTDPGNLASLRDHRDYSLAVPTPEHFVPLAYLAGVATSLGSTPATLVEGYTMGSLSMTAYAVSATSPTADAAAVAPRKR